MKKIKKLLIANRGEIALRIIASAKAMGIHTVAIYSQADKNARFVKQADQALFLGDGSLKETYLNGEKILNLALENGVDAIHPGYGFLSEKSFFAHLLEAKGIILVGPTAASMELMGDKIESKKAVQKMGVPGIPGYHGDNQEISFLHKEADKIGYPVLIKASAGGGGKGMRVVSHSNEFITALEGAKRESLNAFSDDRVLIEKYIQNPRHIEVQVMSDQHGNHLHFFERECSIQRRHQKIIEETPSIALDQKTREKICACAVKIAESINYRGAGTVEFILDDNGEFYFLEMNTRLQVEHPITEIVCGVDLVKWQIKIAQGEKLPMKQNQITQRGHAIEVRLYAEDADHDFLPSIGKIDLLKLPNFPFVRYDFGYFSGDEVTVFFDPMLGKIIVNGEDRLDAIAKMKAVLKEVVVLGPKTNCDFLLRVLNHLDFETGKTFTHLIERKKSDLALKNLTNDQAALYLAAIFNDTAKSADVDNIKLINDQSLFYQVGRL